MTKEFIIDEEKYPELMLLCGHDTNHDFFEKLDPMKQLWGQNGGSLGTYWTDKYSVGQTRQGTPYLDSFITDLDYDKVVKLIDNDYNIYTAISENNYINNPINVETVIRKKYRKFIDIISQILKPEKTKALRKIKEKKIAKERVAKTTTDKEWKPPTIDEEDMTPEDRRITDAVNTQGQSRQFVQRPPSLAPPGAIAVRDKFGGAKTRGEASRRSARTAQPPPDILKQINEAKTSIKKVIHKIKVWDGYVFRVRTQPQLFPTDVKFGDLYEINKELRDDPQIKGDSLFLFSEWIKLPNEKGILNGKSSLLNNDIINYIYEVSDKSQDETEYLSKTYFGFYTVFDNLLEKEKNTDNLKALFLDIKKFALYTSSINIGDDNIKDDDFSINIDTFVKKKWLKYAGPNLKHKNFSLIHNFFSDKDITLTKEEQENIKILKYKIMGWWVDNSGYNPDPDPDHWASKQVIRMKGGDGVESITDSSIRDDFLLTEFEINKNKKNGFFRYDKAWKKQLPTQDVNDNIKGISTRAFGSNAFGNNATSTKFYSDDGGARTLKSLGSPIMVKKDNYNCNTVNVADPASTCPECHGRCSAVDLTVLNNSRDELIKLTINPTNKSLTGNSEIKYKIILPEGEILEGTKDSVNTIESGKKTEGLSKSSVLKDVFSKMSTYTLPRDARRDTYSKILSDYIENDDSIKELVKIFCFKLFGDFGQELYSIYQSFEGYSAYIGNDWISYIRYLFLKKYSRKGEVDTKKRKYPVFYPWYGGFLGNTSFNIIYQVDDIATPPSSPTNKRTKRGGGRRSTRRRRRNTLPKLRVLTYKNKKHKYKLSDPHKKRILAIDEGIRAERKTKKSRREAAVAKKARLNVLRIYRKNKKSGECRKLTQDMKYIDKKYGVGKTKNICKKTQKGGRGKNKTKKKEFLYNPDDPSKSFDVYIDKDPSDTIPIKYTTMKDVKNTIKKLERLYKSGKYSHKRIWQVGMIMYVRLKVLKDKKPKQFKLSERYFKHLGKRTKIKGEAERKKFIFTINM